MPLNARVLAFQEFMTHEDLPLSEIHEAILEFLKDHESAVLIGAQAVNAYVREPRMTQDVDILSDLPQMVARELRSFLAERFRISVRVRELHGKNAFRVYQLRKPANRHLADVRANELRPQVSRFEGILVPKPADLIALKVLSYSARKGAPKSGTDWRDIALLLLQFPELKRTEGTVEHKLKDFGAASPALEAWRELVIQEMVDDIEENGF